MCEDGRTPCKGFARPSAPDRKGGVAADGGVPRLWPGSAFSKGLHMYGCDDHSGRMTAKQAARQQHVLIVDDEEDIRGSLADIIETCIDGTKVFQADSGEAGLQRLQEVPIDLIVTDQRLGGIDGVAFLLEAQRLAPQVPRIMMSAYPDLDLVVEAINEGRIINFLPKPFRAEEVVRVVAEALTARRQERSRRQALVDALHTMRSQRG